ncbi:MAG: HAD-IB family phosphatase [Chloroflexi bacterium]|nr:HAD-IB family phosphatase [Chloroflexota bacterium]
MSNPRVVVLVDFDGTAAAQNVAESLLERYGGETISDGETWKAHREAFRKGEMTLREYQERAFNGVDVTLTEMSEGLKGLCWPREGFEEFVFFCDTNDIQMIIVTNGLHFYVDSVLDHAGLDRLEVCAVGCAGPPGRLRYWYPYETAECWEWGNCKCRVLEESRSRGDVKTVMIGDGYSDYCAARLADVSFARATMRTHCDANGVPCIPFEDFHDVLAAFKAGIPGVWQPPSTERPPP